MLRVYLLIFILGFVGSAAYGAYWYYTDTQNRIAVLRENNAKLETVTKSLEETVNVITADARKNAMLNQQLTQQLQAAEVGLDSLRRRLSEIDLTQEALNDAMDLERRINRGVERLINDFKNDTAIELNIND